MRHPTTSVALSLATVGLLAAGSMSAAADNSPSGKFGHHDIRDLARDGHVAAKRNAHRPGPTAPVTVAEHLAGPLTFAVGDRGKLYVGQSFSGALTLIKPGHAPKDLVSAPGVDVAAVSTKDGAVTWAETVFGQDEVVSAVVKKRAKNGTVRQLADTLAYERSANPDGGTTYGFQGLTPQCLALTPPFLRPYTGLVDSHPYGSAIGRSVTYVADAGANAVLKIDHSGRISTVAVLPGKKVKITAEAAAANGLDPCVAGHDFIFESVPTDVEIGPDGKMYVSSLPGGPEDGSTGANGSVYRVNPKTGAVKLIATGFAGATNIAIAPNGTIYVAELFGGQVSSISRHGTVRPVVSLSQPAGLEWASGYLYASTNVFGDGSIVKFKVR
jgi:hypothetical protein